LPTEGNEKAGGNFDKHGSSDFFVVTISPRSRCSQLQRPDSKIRSSSRMLKRR